VFTAHPTFLLNPAQADAVATAALADDPLASTVCALPANGPKITLEFEHLEVCNAIERAGHARDRINATLLAHARQRWPGRWLDFRPLPFRFATWVGYDMDGRTDIGWHTSVAFRLREKARRLAAYSSGLPAWCPITRWSPRSMRRRPMLRKWPSCFRARSIRPRDWHRRPTA
jgi:phosphoenolpyruvate carboxylase